jgi:hypothetical protein
MNNLLLTFLGAILDHFVTKIRVDIYLCSYLNAYNGSLLSVHIQ